MHFCTYQHVAPAGMPSAGQSKLLYANVTGSCSLSFAQYSHVVPDTMAVKMAKGALQPHVCTRQRSETQIASQLYTQGSSTCTTGEVGVITHDLKAILTGENPHSGICGIDIQDSRSNEDPRPEGEDQGVNSELHFP